MASAKKRTSFGVDTAKGCIHLGRWTIGLPQSRLMRIVVGCLLIIGGIAGFLPILGFWMLPLGFLVLSQDIGFVRRKRRQVSVWWSRRQAAKAQAAGKDR